MSDTNVSTEPRFDRYGEIRLIGVVRDKGARKNWIVVKRKGHSRALCITEAAWLAFSPTPTGARAIGAARLSIHGVV